MIYIFFIVPLLRLRKFPIYSSFDKSVYDEKVLNFVTFSSFSGSIEGIWSIFSFSLLKGWITRGGFQMLDSLSILGINPLSREVLPHMFHHVSWVPSANTLLWIFVICIHERFQPVVFFSHNMFAWFWYGVSQSKEGSVIHINMDSWMCGFNPGPLCFCSEFSRFGRWGPFELAPVSPWLSAFTVCSCVLFSEHVLTFWNHKTLEQCWNQLFLWGALFPFVGRRH